MIKRALFLCLFLMCLSGLNPAAMDKSPVNIDKNGIAIKGYDPVAYFTQGEPAKGLVDYSYNWNQAIWHFSSSQNREVFVADPEKYAPQYGGYCAYAMASGDLVDIDPYSWKIHDGKLYLNFSPKVQKKWEKKMEYYIKKADLTWPDVLKK